MPDRPFVHLLDETADRWPGSPALSYLGRDITYRELRHDVEQLSTCLARLGVSRGDRVALVLPNCPQLVIGVFAVVRLGAVAVPLSPAMSSELLTEAFVDSGAEVVICLDRVYQRVADARSDPATALREVVVTLRADYLPALDRITLTVPTRSVRRERARACGSVPLGAGVRMWSEELRRARGVPVPPPGWKESSPSTDPAVIVYPPRPADPASPGGGQLRGVVLTGRNLWAAGAQAAAWLTHVRPGREAIVVGVPLTTAEGLALCVSAATLLGAAVQLIPLPFAEAVPTAVSGLRPSVAIGPPAFLDEILGPGDRNDETVVDLRSLRLCVTGPDLLDPADVDRLERLSGTPVVDGSSVPGAPVLLGRPMRAGRPGDEHPSSDGRGPRPIGIPLPSTDVRIVDPAGVPLPPGRAGRLEVRGPQVSAEVWGHPEETEALLHDGWLITSLMGCRHPDGWIELLR